MDNPEIGNEVILKSGGSYMSINGFASDPNGSDFSSTEPNDYCFCVWKDDNNSHEEHYFHKTTLTKVERDEKGTPSYIK